MNKKSKIIIGILIAIILVLVTVIVVGIVLSTNKAIEERKKEEISKYSAREVIEYLEEQGYKFKNSEYTYIYTTKYVYVSNENNSIAFQKITSNIMGISYSWQNGDINDAWPEIKSTYKNKTEEEEKQYKEYEKWLEYEGLTTKQLTDALDYYGNYGGEYEKMDLLLDN